LPLAESPDCFFANQYVAADSIYALHQHIPPAYQKPAATLNNNKRLNELATAQHVHIEHVNGVQIGRWGSLDSICILINSLGM
jgi:hypothetical protein